MWRCTSRSRSCGSAPARRRRRRCGCAARPGEPGYLLGKDAEAAACDARTTPVVTGHADMRVVDKIIALALAAASITLDGADPAGDDDDDDDDDDASLDNDSSHRSWGTAGGGPRAASRARLRARERFTPDAMQALRYAIARLAIDFVSGPAGIAAWLRTTLLAPPYSTPSLPLDIGYSDSIPASIRRAVQLRDRGCAWPRCGQTGRLVRRAPPAAQGRRRQDRRERLRAAVPVPPRRVHPPPRLAARAAPRRHHDGLRTRRAGAAQPLTTHPPRRVEPGWRPGTGLRCRRWLRSSECT